VRCEKPKFGNYCKRKQGLEEFWERVWTDGSLHQLIRTPLVAAVFISPQQRIMRQDVPHKFIFYLFTYLLSTSSRADISELPWSDAVSAKTVEQRRTNAFQLCLSLLPCRHLIPWSASSRSSTPHGWSYPGRAASTGRAGPLTRRPSVWRTDGVRWVSDVESRHRTRARHLLIQYSHNNETSTCCGDVMSLDPLA